LIVRPCLQRLLKVQVVVDGVGRCPRPRLRGSVLKVMFAAAANALEVIVAVAFAVHHGLDEKEGRTSWIDETFDRGWQSDAAVQARRVRVLQECGEWGAATPASVLHTVRRWVGPSRGRGRGRGREGQPSSYGYKRYCVTAKTRKKRLTATWRFESTPRKLQL